MFDRSGSLGSSLQWAKAQLPNLCTDEGYVTSLSMVQLPKVFSGMLSSGFSSTAFFSLLPLLNTDLPKFFTEDGTKTSSIYVWPKALSPMVSTDGGIMSLLISLPSNA